MGATVSPVRGLSFGFGEVETYLGSLCSLAAVIFPCKGESLTAVGMEVLPPELEDFLRFAFHNRFSGRPEATWRY